MLIFFYHEVYGLFFSSSQPTNNFFIQAQKVGLLIKRVSMLSTVSARLNLFNKLIKQVLYLSISKTNNALLSLLYSTCSQVNKGVPFLANISFKVIF